MAFEGPQNFEGAASNAVTSEDSIFGAVIAGVATAEWVLGEVKVMLQASDAEDLGMDAAYDANNGLRAYTEIKEYFRLHPTGKLYAILTATGQTLSELCDNAGSALVDLLNYEEPAGAETAKPGIKFVGVISNRSVVGSIWKATISAPGADYVAGDLITATDGAGEGFQVKVTTVDGTGGVTGIEIVSRGTGYTTVPTAFSTDSTAGAGCTITPAYYVPAFTSGLDNSTETGAAKAQATADAFFAQAVYVDGVFIEALLESGASLSSLPDARLWGHKQVHLVAAQDPAITNLNTAYSSSADIGSALGMLSIRDVSENLGSVDIVNKPAALKGNLSYPLTSSADGRWLKAALTNGLEVNTENMSLAVQKSLDDKGYIFVGKYEGFPGKFFSGDPSCVSAIHQKKNIRSNRVWNKAVRIVRQTLIPKMKGKVTKDKDGKIRSGLIAHWEELVKINLTTLMKNTDQVSDYSFFINPTTTVNGDGKTVITHYLKIVQVDSAEVIEGYTSFVTNL